METKKTITATIPGIGAVQITKERAEQIKRLQKIIKENSKANVLQIPEGRDLER